jgi:hypothetical protein
MESGSFLTLYPPFETKGEGRKGGRIERCLTRQGPCSAVAARLHFPQTSLPSAPTTTSTSTSSQPPSPGNHLISKCVHSHIQSQASHRTQTQSLNIIIPFGVYRHSLRLSSPLAVALTKEGAIIRSDSRIRRPATVHLQRSNRSLKSKNSRLDERQDRSDPFPTPTVRSIVVQSRNRIVVFRKDNARPTILSAQEVLLFTTRASSLRPHSLQIDSFSSSSICLRSFRIDIDTLSIRSAQVETSQAENDKCLRLIDRIETD